MHKYIQVFFDRLAQRLVVIASRLVASSVDSLHAALQASEQSRLEDLARQYESEGKHEIAVTLQNRIRNLTNESPADEAMTTIKSFFVDNESFASLYDASTDDADVPPAPWQLGLPDDQKPVTKKLQRKKTKRSRAKKNDGPPLENSTEHKLPYSL